MINHDDWIWKHDNRQRYKFYRCYCSVCGKDRGYQEKKAAGRKCKECYYLSKIKPKPPKIKKKREYKNKIVRSDTWREKIKKSALKRRGVPLDKKIKQKIADKLTGKPTGRAGTSVPKEVKIKISCSLRGIKREDFNGFATTDTRKENNTLTVKARNACYSRDNHACRKCGARGGFLNAHHISSWKFFPELRYEVSNLVTLCRSCHREFHSRFGSGIKTPNTSEQMDMFLLDDPAPTQQDAT